MNVLMISGDKNILMPGSGARLRFELQKASVDRLDAYVWPKMQSWREISLAAQKTKYDVVTAQDPFWRGLLAWRIARGIGAKLNFQVHTDLSAEPLLRRLLANFLLRRADSVRVVSEEIQEQVKAARTTAQIHILPIFVDVSRFENLTPKYHSQKTILWIGRFEREKDPLFAIRVLNDVRTKGIDAQLVMLGAGGLETVLRRAAKALPVEFPGWQDTKSYLEVADVVLCTSRYESWGAGIIEALAAGVPVVAPDVGVARKAGAYVVSRAELSSKVIEVLQQGVRSALLLDLPNAEEWAKQWRETLV